MPRAEAGIGGSLRLVERSSVDLAPSTTCLWKRELDNFLVFHLFAAAVLWRQPRSQVLSPTSRDLCSVPRRYQSLIIARGFCDIQNNQVRGKWYTLIETFIIPAVNVILYIILKKITTHTVARNTPVRDYYCSLKNTDLIKVKKTVTCHV